MKNEKGFSLIELSIVLIIIGLLVSGITGGASLINSARVRATMTEVTNYRIAVNTFYSAKDFYPGDTDASPDGQILGSEMDDCWEDLESVGAVDKDYGTATSPYTSLFGLGYTKNAAAGWLMGYYDSAEGTAGTEYDYNAIALTDLGTPVLADAVGIEEATTASGVGNVIAGTTGINAGAMDTKMDNGTQATGDVVGVDGWLTDETVTTCSYTAAAEYCVPIFKIDL